MTNALIYVAHVSAEDAIHFDTEVGLLLGALLLAVLAVIWLV